MLKLRTVMLMQYCGQMKHLDLGSCYIFMQTIRINDDFMIEMMVLWLKTGIFIIWGSYYARAWKKSQATVGQR